MVCRTARGRSCSGLGTRWNHTRRGGTEGGGVACLGIVLCKDHYHQLVDGCTEILVGVWCFRCSDQKNEIIETFGSYRNIFRGAEKGRQKRMLAWAYVGVKGLQKGVPIPFIQHTLRESHEASATRMYKPPMKAPLEHAQQRAWENRLWYLRSANA